MSTSKCPGCRRKTHERKGKVKKELNPTKLAEVREFLEKDIFEWFKDNYDCPFLGTADALKIAEATLRRGVRQKEAK